MKTDLKKAIEKAEKLKKKGDYSKAINLLLKTRKNISSELMKLPPEELMFQVTKYDKPREKLELELRKRIKELNNKLNLVGNMKLHIYSMLTDEEIKELVQVIIYEKDINMQDGLFKTSEATMKQEKKKFDVDKKIDRIWDGMEEYMNRKEKQK